MTPFSEETQSFEFDKLAADRELVMQPIRELILAVLAREPPKQPWKGCEVNAGDTPLALATTHRIATRGPAAGELQQRLIETLERLHVPVLAVYEGGPGLRELIARVRGANWAEG